MRPDGRKVHHLGIILKGRDSGIQTPFSHSLLLVYHNVMSFPLPCPTGEGQPLDSAALAGMLEKKRQQTEKIWELFGKEKGEGADSHERIDAPE